MADKTTVETLIDELEEITELKTRVESELAEAKKAGQDELVESIRAKVAIGGYDIDEIIARLKKPERKWKRVGKVYGYQGKEYSRGPLPLWLKDAIIAEGLDPKIAKDRRVFKDTCMTVLHEDSSPEAVAKDKAEAAAREQAAQQSDESEAIAA